MKTHSIYKAILGLVCGVGFLCAQIPVAKQPQPKSQKEIEALMAMFNAQDPDSRIKAANELILKFADTEFKAIALQIAAMSYREKNDAENMIIFAEKTLEADSKNFDSMLMIAKAVAQRTREFDLDKEEKLGRAEKLAKQAEELAKVAPKPRPDITDDQWEQVRGDAVAEAQETLGMVAIVRKQPDAAINAFQLAIEKASQADPTLYYRLSAAYNLAGKHDLAISMLDKLNGLDNVHPQIQQLAEEERKKAMAAKAGQ